jgi:hypothetical protein
MTYNNSHKVLGINYFREKAIAASVVILIVLLALWLTNGHNSEVLADSDGDGVLDNVDKCPKEKGLMRFDGCLSENSGVSAQASGVGEGSSASVAGQKVPGSSALNSNAKTGSEEIGFKESEMVLDNQSSGNNQFTNNEPAPPSNVQVKKQVTNVDANLAFNPGSNVFTWDNSCEKAREMYLKITDSNGSLVQYEKVTGKTSYTFSPNRGTMQGKRLNAELISNDEDFKLIKRYSKGFSPNCSAEE